MSGTQKLYGIEFQNGENTLYLVGLGRPGIGESTEDPITLEHAFLFSHLGDPEKYNPNGGITSISIPRNRVKGEIKDFPYKG